MHYEELMENVVKAFEVTGVVILAIGSIAALADATAALRGGERRSAYRRARQGVGRSVLLGLEVLIIADIIMTITIDPTVESALTLGVIVLVRTFLSFSLEIELTGTLPWRRRKGRTRSERDSIGWWWCSQRQRRTAKLGSS
jgi:uncharacterized membrane protein